MSSVVKVENISKCYKLGVINRSTFADELKYRWSKLRGRNPREHLGRIGASREHINESEFWALKDVSFEVNQGDVVGFIGKNGAGKSTMLKILTRITEPTSGRAVIHGRVGSLLEVGTGFHPELTGRENIYMNGTILGMKHGEIEAKFDEIVDFSGVEQFLDTPVKRYSSGMYVRLAFAVAAHLDPEILLIDEVLAVGDAEFQKKCLGKMGEIARGGRTVLFVSHNMPSLLNLCTSGILFESGRVAMTGEIEQVVSHYLGGRGEPGRIQRPDDLDKDWCIRSVEVGESQQTLFMNSTDLNVRIVCTVHSLVPGAQLAFEFRNQHDECIFSTTNRDLTADHSDLFPPGNYEWSCRVPLGMYRAGSYSIFASASVPGIRMLDACDASVCFDIQDVARPIYKLGQNRRGTILPIYDWQFRVIPQEETQRQLREESSKSAISNQPRSHV